MKKAILTFLAILIANPAHSVCIIGGGNITLGYPEHQCSKPYVPSCVYSRNCSEWEVSSFKSDLESYRNCINEYLDNVENDISCAKERASDALDEYNNFVNSF